jgi:hypothetical protein
LTVPRFVFDEPAFVAQPLGLGRLGVALIIFAGSPAKRKGARGRIGVTLSSAALVLVVIQPRRRARWLLRMVNIEAASRRRGSSLRSAS